VIEFNGRKNFARDNRINCEMIYEASEGRGRPADMITELVRGLRLASSTSNESI
jgi:hypothetical protein